MQLINKEDLVRDMGSYVVGGVKAIEDGYGNDWLGGMHTALQIIDDMDIIDATPVKRGYWKKCSSYFKCSNCPHKEVRKTYYCSHCGSKMEVDKE